MGKEGAASVAGRRTGVRWRGVAFACILLCAFNPAATRGAFTDLVENRGSRIAAGRYSAALAWSQDGEQFQTLAQGVLDVAGLESPVYLRVENGEGGTLPFLYTIAVRPDAGATTVSAQEEEYAAGAQGQPTLCPAGTAHRYRVEYQGAQTLHVDFRTAFSHANLPPAGPVHVSDAQGLLQAVAEAADGDTIYLDAGIYGPVEIDTDKNLTLCGAEGARLSGGLTVAQNAGTGALKFENLCFDSAETLVRVQVGPGSGRPRALQFVNCTFQADCAVSTAVCANVAGGNYYLIVSGCRFTSAEGNAMQYFSASGPAAGAQSVFQFKGNECLAPPPIGKAALQDPVGNVQIQQNQVLFPEYGVFAQCGVEAAPVSVNILNNTFQNAALTLVVQPYNASFTPTAYRVASNSFANGSQAAVLAGDYGLINAYTLDLSMNSGEGFRFEWLEDAEQVMEVRLPL
jgi:hypothetical protein